MVLVNIGAVSKTARRAGCISPSFFGQQGRILAAQIGLTPQGGEHRYYLLLAAHYAGQEDHVILGFGGEGAADGNVAADVEKPGALEKNVGEHEDDDVVAVI